MAAIVPFALPLPVPRDRVPRVSSSRRQRPICATLRQFAASDFELRRLVGQQGYATITDWEYFSGDGEGGNVRDPLLPTRTTEASEPAVRLYEATMISPAEYRNSRVLLKEYLQVAEQLAINEATAYNILYTGATNITTIPIARCLGKFLTDDAFDSVDLKQTWARRFPRSPTAPTPGAPFLVFPYSEYGYSGQDAAGRMSEEEQVPGARWLNAIFPSAKLAQRSRYARALCAGAVNALQYMHESAGLVHRSIGLASISVNTIEERYAGTLSVKLRDLGFTKRASELVDTTQLLQARKAGAVTPSEIVLYMFAEDIYSLGYALVEYIFATFSSIKRTQDFFKKIFEETFNFDIASFRSYCAQDQDYVDAVSFLDEGEQAGWKFLVTMLDARNKYKETTLAQVAEMQFLQL